MELLGFKRAVLLAALVVINLLIAGAYFGLIMPMKEEADMHLTSTRNEIARLQTEIENIKAELRTFKETLPQYEALEAKGFFLNQDRFFLGRTLEDIKNRSQLRGFSFAINDIQEVENSDAATAERQLISSRIKIDRVISLLDIGFFDFIDVIQTYFPSHVRIQSFSLSKLGKIDDQTLARVAKEPAASLINADLEMDWFTITAPPPPAPAAGTGVP